MIGFTYILMVLGHCWACFSFRQPDLCEAMYFYEHWLKGIILQSKECGIESFHMSYLEFAIGFFCQLHEFTGFIHGIGQGLFNKYMFAFAQGHIT